MGRLYGIGVALCVVSLLAAGGCPSASKLPPQLPAAAGHVAQKSLPEIRRRIQANSAAISSLRAEVDAWIYSPLMRPNRVPISGRLAAGPNGEIYLELGRVEHTQVQVIGDGQHYRVEAFGTDYGGTYGESLSPQSSRIHILPEDLACALQPQMLFEGRSQVLRSYPQRGDIIAGSWSEPVIYPPTWSIDSIQVEESPPRAWVENSLMIDRRTERLLRLDRFGPDGTLTRRISYRGQNIVTGPGNAAVRLPSALLIWYPPPLEETVVYLQFSSWTLNVSLPKDLFQFSN